MTYIHSLQNQRGVAPRVSVKRILDKTPSPPLGEVSIAKLSNVRSIEIDPGRTVGRTDPPPMRYTCRHQSIDT
ncbi:hypothetical protein CBM2591_A300084 [Cupriavidus taiwanensis]|nr:hypothetical protein CBM2591_A300084 [Cupriavidus taiwanensis]